MTHAGRRRVLCWEGSSRKDLKKFPIGVQKDLGVALFVVQIGEMPPSARSWKGVGPGVYELVEDHHGDTFRVVFATGIGDSVHVLHAFQKKSKSGISTPKQVAGFARTPCHGEEVTSMKQKAQRKGTENVLVDLGFDDAKELSARATLAVKLNRLIDEQNLSQAEAAKILGMPQPRISAIRNYKLRGISLERLMWALTAFGQHVEIVVSPSSRRAPARISVAA